MRVSLLRSFIRRWTKFRHKLQQEFIFSLDWLPTCAEIRPYHPPRDRVWIGSAHLTKEDLVELCRRVWKKVESQEDLGHILSGIAPPFSSYVVTEFEVTPSNGFRVPTLIQEGSFYYLDKTCCDFVRETWWRRSWTEHYLFCDNSWSGSSRKWIVLDCSKFWSKTHSILFRSKHSRGTSMRKVSPLCKVFTQYTLDLKQSKL